MSDHLSYRPEIDGLRAVAVLSVVLCHARLPGFSGGFVGVDVFFVISGFLITSILLRDPPGLARFYHRRARRILPALVVMLLTCLTVGWVTFPPDHFADLGRATLATLAFASNLWFWQQTGNYFASIAEMTPLLHTWSLAVEEQFYILFPLVLWGALSRGRRVALGSVLGLSALSFALSIWATGRADTANFYLSLTRAWELGLGAALAFVPVRNAGQNRTAVACVGVILIVAPVVLYDTQTLFPGLAALPPCLGAMAILWAGARGGVVASILSCAPMRFVGVISYSLYLWHWPVLVFVRIARGGVALSAMDTALCLGVSSALAVLSWRVIETPVRRGQVALAPVFVAATGAAMLAIAVTQSQGWPTRIAPDTLHRYETALHKTSTQTRCLAQAECRIGAEDGVPSMMIWGDSHANELIPGAELWLTRHAQSAIAATRPACPPLPGLIRGASEADRACADHNAKTLKLALESPVRTVVLHARWALNTTGTRPDGEAGRDVTLRLEDPSLTPMGSDNAALVQASLTGLVDRLTTAGKRVVLIDTVPEVGWNAPLALFAQDRLGVDLPDLPALSEFQTRNRAFRDAIGPLTFQGRMQVISAADALCPSGCKVSEGDHSLYRDDDHLSTHASALIVPGLLDQIAPLDRRTAGW